MKKILLFFLVVLMCAGYAEAGHSANKKEQSSPPYSTIFVKRPKTVKGPRSTALPIVGTILQGRIVLDSPDESGMAYIVISGSSAYLCELADFTDHSASVDISELEAGIYTATIEFENGAEYTGQFELL